MALDKRGIHFDFVFVFTIFYSLLLLLFTSCTERYFTIYSHSFALTLSVYRCAVPKINVLRISIYFSFFSSVSPVYSSHIQLLQYRCTKTQSWHHYHLCALMHINRMKIKVSHPRWRQNKKIHSERFTKTDKKSGNEQEQNRFMRQMGLFQAPSFLCGFVGNTLYPIR